MANKKIGFIGVGMMGHGMAKNLVEKGFPTTILGHENRAPVEDLVKHGAKEAKDVAGLVAASDIVFICVTGSPQVEDLVYARAEFWSRRARDRSWWIPRPASRVRR